MSITTELQRIQQAKTDLKTAIESKGVTIEDTATIDTYAPKVDDVYSAGYEKGRSEGGSPAPERIVLATAFTNANGAYTAFENLCTETERGALFTFDASLTDTLPNNQCLEFLFIKNNKDLSGYRRNSSSTSATGSSNAQITAAYSIVGNIGDVFIKEVLL